MKKNAVGVCIVLIMVICLSSTFLLFNINFESSSKAYNVAVGAKENYIRQMKAEYNVDVQMSKVKILNDFDGNTYTLTEFSPAGFMIYNEEAELPVEYSAISLSPYLEYDKDLYYGGPGQFFVKRNNLLIHTITGEELYINKISDLSEHSRRLYADNLKMKAALKAEPEAAGEIGICSSSQTVGGKTLTCVNFSQFFVNLDNPIKMGYVSGGYCAYIAGNILLGWYDTFISDSFVNNNHMTPRSDGVNRMYKNSNLTQELINIGGSNSVSISTLKKTMNKYFSNHGINASSYTITTPFFSGTTIKNNIASNRPVIVLGSLHNPQTGGKVAHASVFYGYVKGGYGLNAWGFLAHYGWSGYSAVTVNVSNNSIFTSMYKIEY